MTLRVIKLVDNTKEAILQHPRLGPMSLATLSAIINFKRNNKRALEVRNYAMNYGKAMYFQYEKNQSSTR